MKHCATEKVKFLKLKRRLNLPQWQVVGVLESIWLFTQKNARAGDIGRFSDEDIAAGIEWAGNAEILINAMVECGWLDRCPVNRLVVHDWAEHAPTWVKGSMKRHGAEFIHATKEPAKEATKEPPKEPPKEDAREASEASSEPPPNLTQPNLTKPKEEDSPEPPKPAGSEPPVMTFPTNGHGPKEWPLTASKLEEYRLAFPGIDVLAQCRMARQWSIDNRTKRKTFSGMPAFLTRWLTKAQDRGPQPAPPSTNGHMTKRAAEVQASIDRYRQEQQRG